MRNRDSTLKHHFRAHEYFESLPLPWHHRDPFDRMLIAQARLEDLTLVTHDERLRGYAVEVHWA